MARPPGSQTLPNYTRSPALAEWFNSRRANVDELIRAHAAVGNAGPGAGAGRPPKAGTEQINEALVLRITTEFQGFVRDLLDLTTIKIVRGSGCATQFQAQVIAMGSRDRMIDRGNPHLDAIKKDFGRLGLANVGADLAATNPKHAEDKAALQTLVELRNAIAHDDRDKLASFASDGITATKGYATTARASLGRIARALDGVAWDYLLQAFPAVHPWSPR